jgi:DNA-binding CsgD family transcriptional regulator
VLSYSNAVELRERERELATLGGVLDQGRVLVLEGGAGIGKTALLDEVCGRATQAGWQVVRARGSELESGFAFGVVRQLFELHLAQLHPADRAELLAGPAAATRPLWGESDAGAAHDSSFAVLHGLYWLTANMAAVRPLLVVVDDAHWADAPSLRWLAYLAPRLEGLAAGLLVAVRPAEPASGEDPLLAVRQEAVVVRPRLLSQAAVTAIVQDRMGGQVSEQLSAAVTRVSGGNPFYVRELARAVAVEGAPLDTLELGGLFTRGVEGVAVHLAARARRLGPRALSLAQALAVLGDGCQLRHAAAIAGLDMEDAARVAAGLVRVEVLAEDAPPRFLHPIVREAVEASLGSAERDAAHRAAARVLHEDGAPPGQVAAHLIKVRPAGDGWVLTRLREAAHAALSSGAPQGAAELLTRALAEPPPPEQRVTLLRETARAEATVGRDTARGRLEQALALTADPHEQAEIGLDLAAVYAEMYRRVEAVDVLERALADLGDADAALAARLEGELVLLGFLYPRCAPRVAPVLERLTSCPVAGAAAETRAAAQGLARYLAGRPVDETAPPLARVLTQATPRPESWSTRLVLLWTLVACESFDAVEVALGPMLAEARKSGSASGLMNTHLVLSVLNLHLGALPEADTAARVALRVASEGDFVPLVPATILAEVAIEAGQLDEAQALLALLPEEGWAPGLATARIPNARGRLRLAQGRAAEALADFQACAAMISPEVWGIDIHDVGNLHFRSGAALALLQLGDNDRARELAEAELGDARAARAYRAIGIALRVAGLTEGGPRGLELLGESVTVLQGTPAVLERAHSLCELGAALRRAGQRADARGMLAQALELAARCGARPLATRARDELNAAGARPRREWRTGVEALTPGELRVARLAAEGQTNREIAHALYVTMKTVESHLAHGYAKLGIAGRAELPNALRRTKIRVSTPQR